MDGKFYMLNWQLWTGTKADWDESIQSLHNFTIYQSYAWGEHKSNLGWLTLRLVCYKALEVTAMAQIQVKKFPFSFAIIWIPGGPVGDVLLWNKDFQHAINSAVGARYIYCRINSMLENSESSGSKLISLGWMKSKFPMLSGRSLLYKPSENEDIRQKQCSGNWRHNLRRSFKRNLFTSVWEHPKPNEMMAVYTAMQDHKKLNPQISFQEIESLIKEFDNRCILIRCDNDKGDLLAFRGALILGQRAWDIFAAATPEGRKVYASHAAFWELIKQCALRKVQWYDMSGVDPLNNPGVYDFKKGTGAHDFNYLGEWEYARPSVFRYIAGRVIAWRYRL